jgi:hypothetical protein
MSCPFLSSLDLSDRTHAKAREVAARGDLAEVWAFLEEYNIYDADSLTHFSELPFTYPFLPVRLPCGHAFGRDCVAQVFHATAMYPLCRRPAARDSSDNAFEPRRVVNGMNMRPQNLIWDATAKELTGRLEDMVEGLAHAIDLFNAMIAGDGNTTILFN